MIEISKEFCGKGRRCKILIFSFFQPLWGLVSCPHSLYTVHSIQSQFYFHPTVDGVQRLYRLYWQLGPGLFKFSNCARPALPKGCLSTIISLTLCLVIRGLYIYIISAKLAIWNFSKPILCTHKLISLRNVFPFVDVLYKS